MEEDLDFRGVQVPLAGSPLSVSEALLVKRPSDQRRPCVLVRTPYPKLIALEQNHGLLFAKAGYTVVVQSVRGRHGSQGRFIPFSTEEDDGQTAIDWCLRQPWCDGRLFMMGKSYEGFAAWTACNSKAQVPISGLVVSMTAADPTDWFYEGGAFRQAFAQSWGLSLPFTDENTTVEEVKELDDLARDLLALYSLPPALSPLGRLLPGYYRWLSPKSLKELETGFTSGRTIPLHMTTGWSDIFLCGSLKDIAASQRSGDRVVIGPWSHDTLGERLVGNKDYGFLATRKEFDVPADRLAWMNSCLQNGRAVTSCSYFVLGSNEWRQSESWPPTTQLYQLELQRSRPLWHIRSGEDKVKSTRCPTPGGRVHNPLLPLAGGFDCHGLLSSNRVVNLVCQPCSTSLTIAGSVQLLVTFSTVVPSLYGWLLIRTENGELDCVASAALCISPEQQSHSVTLVFNDTAVELMAGSCFVVALADSSFPEFYCPPEAPMKLSDAEINKAVLAIRVPVPHS